MTAIDWAKETVERVREDGRDGVTESMYELYVGGLRRTKKLYNPGRSIFDKEWDVLLVLDACRYDLMRQVADEYDFIESVEEFTSLGSSSNTWMEANFRGEPRTAETAYVTGNPFSEAVLDGASFRVLDEVWQYNWDEELGTIRPRPITDRAIDTWRNRDAERMVVHYMQPHYPFLQDPDLHQGMVVSEFGQGKNVPFWQRVRRGDVTDEEAWSAYRRNLRSILDEVEFFLDRVDADTVAISADHGNAIGEYGIYGHPANVPIPQLRKVPWIETTAEQTVEYEPETKRNDQTDSVDEATESRLEDLGYV